MKPIRLALLLLPALLLAVPAVADDAQPPDQQQQAPWQHGPAPRVEPIIPKLRVVGDAPKPDEPPPPPPPKKRHRHHCRYGAERIDGKLHCRKATPPP